MLLMSDHGCDKEGARKLPVVQVNHPMLQDRHCDCFRQGPAYPEHHTSQVQCILCAFSTLSLCFCYAAEAAEGQGAASLQKVDLAFAL